MPARGRSQYQEQTPQPNVPIPDWLAHLDRRSAETWRTALEESRSHTSPLLLRPLVKPSSRHSFSGQLSSPAPSLCSLPNGRWPCSPSVFAFIPIEELARLS